MKTKKRKVNNSLSQIFFKNFIGTLIIIVNLLLITNYFEIVCKNVRPNPQYSSWNVIASALYSEN